MTSADNSVVSLKSLLDAVRNDDVQRLKFLLSINPKILDLAAKNWPEHPLISVCKMRSFSVVEEIRIRKPEFAHLKDDKDCHALLHWSCVRGDVEMVKVLVSLDSQLCFVHVSMLSMIPLHIAVIHGRLNVIRELLRARPESLETLTSLKESALHLAAKNRQNDAFAFLLKEVKPDQTHLLYGFDSEGSSALEIATGNNLCTEGHIPVGNGDSDDDCNINVADEIEVLASNIHSEIHLTISDDESEESDKQLPEIPSGNLFIISDDESEESDKQLPNIHSDYPFIISDCYVDNGPVLEAVTVDELERFPNGIRGCNSRWWLFEKRKFMLIFPAILLGLGFSSTVILPYFFPREKSIPNNQVVFQFRDIVTIHLPPVFYIMTLITIVITTSSINLTVLLISLPFRSYLFLCGISTFALYVLLTYCTMPRFFVSIGSHDVSSFQVMWTLALGLVFLVVVIFRLVKYCFNKPILRRKVVRESRGGSMHMQFFFLILRILWILNWLRYSVMALWRYGVMASSEPPQPSVMALGL